MLKQLILALSLLLLSVSLTACSTKKDDEVAVFTHTNKQFAPEPIYNRLRWVQLPTVIPPTPKDIADSTPSSDAPLILPVIHLELYNSPLKEAAQLIADSSSYNSYCSSDIVDQKITINTLGTLNELLDEVAKTANIDTVVDHKTRTIRFMGR